MREREAPFGGAAKEPRESEENMTKCGRRNEMVFGEQSEEAATTCEDVREGGDRERKEGKGVRRQIRRLARAHISSSSSKYTGKSGRIIFKAIMHELKKLFWGRLIFPLFGFLYSHEKSPVGECKERMVRAEGMGRRFVCKGAGGGRRGRGRKEGHQGRKEGGQAGG